MNDRNSFADKDGKTFHRMKDLTGNVYGSLEVISFYAMNEHHQSLWVCRCSCGKEIVCNSNTLKDGDKKSCGCIKRPGKPKRLSRDDAKFNVVYSVYKHGAEARNLSFSLSEDDVRHLIELDCFYCGQSAVVNGRNGIDRINNDRGYEIDNVVSCCKTCNYAKNTLSYADFKNWIHRIADHMLSKEMLYASAGAY